MSRYQWAASLLIVYHVSMLSALALPDRVKPRVPSESYTPLARLVAPILEHVAGWTASATSAGGAIAQPLRPLGWPYFRWGMAQRWAMFSHPWTEDQYLRIDYTLVPDSPSDARPVFRQLVYPAQPEDRIRLAHAFRDKAVTRTLELFWAALEKADDQGARAAIEALIRDQRRKLEIDLQSRTILRVDLWHGSATIPRPGEKTDVATTLARLSAVSRYRGGAVVLDSERPASLYQRRREVDISWQLIYSAWR